MKAHNILLRNYFFLVLVLFFIKNFCQTDIDQQIGNDMAEINSVTKEQKKLKPFVQKYILDNGLTILFLTDNTIPKVSMQLWYDVGSKNEGVGERGYAHLLEHMIFKGTNRLSEADIDSVTHTLSGYCNAFTSYDYTGYLFNFPKQHYKEGLFIFADCMRNCTFKEDMLNSEMKAVIQEFKMGKDRYTSILIQDMISMMFPDHPYHYPVIGYKHDLFSVTGKDLKKFYDKHYHPNNATLIMVGDFDEKDA